MTKHPEPVAVGCVPEKTIGGRLARHTPACIAILIAAAVGVLVFRESPLAFLAAMTDGVVAVGILAAASLAGLWIVWGTGNGDLPVRWQIGLGAGFGIGGLSLGMLWAGLRGYMGQTAWWVVLSVLAVAGLAALYRLGQPDRKGLIAPADPTEATGPLQDDSAAGYWRWMWLLIVPVVVLAVLAATVPPGLLWEQEANGFDVLEYHLGAPREWFFAGQIVHLDHNMYSDFPMNAEMLYLLSMILYGSPWKIAIVAQFISLGLGGLAAYTAWLIGRDYSPRVGIITGMAGAAFPWMTYLGVLAYVESGMMFYGLLAAGLCSRALRDPRERSCWRGLALGAVVGLACGYKYTAIPMIAVPLLAVWAVLSLRQRRFSNAIIPMIIAITAFAPWATKNQRMTGNPVFPLGYSVFGAKDSFWSAAQNQQFVEAHKPLPKERPLPQRVALLWKWVIAEPRFGYVPWAVAALAAGLLLRRRMAHRGQIAVWLAVLLVQILLWMFATHLFARFACVLWIPLVLLIAAVAAWLTATRNSTQPRTRTAPATARAWHPDLGMAICMLGLTAYGLVGQGWLWPEYNRHMRPRGELLPLQGAPELFYYGRVEGSYHLQYINGNGKSEAGLPLDAKLLMVGDALVYYVGRPCDYWVTFNRSPFVQAVEAAGGQGKPVLEWLRKQGYTHVWANFNEMHRLRTTYGFPASVDVPLFERLEAAGLRRAHEVRNRTDEPPYGILYEVPRS